MATRLQIKPAGGTVRFATSPSLPGRQKQNEYGRDSRHRLNVLELNEIYLGVAAPHPWPTRIRVSTRRKSTWLTFAPLDVLKGYASNVSKPLPKSPVRTNEYSENPRDGGNKMNESESSRSEGWHG